MVDGWGLGFIVGALFGTGLFKDYVDFAYAVGFVVELALQVMSSYRYARLYFRELPPYRRKIHRLRHLPLNPRLLQHINHGQLEPWLPPPPRHKRSRTAQPSFRTRTPLCKVITVDSPALAGDEDGLAEIVNSLIFIRYFDKAGLGTILPRLPAVFFMHYTEK